MVFCNTRINVDFVVRNLRGKGIKAMAIHGGFSQAKRDRTIKSFHAQHVPVLVCTDVAARGLDIQGVTRIYNYDLPKESKQYIHRIGRTARAGEKGKAISLLSSRDHDNFSRVLRDFPVQVVEEKRPRVERVRLNWIGRPRHRGYKGKTMHHGHRRSGTGSFGSRGFSRKRFS
jgi:ATP-dependent RNA helicase DeaD